MRGSPGPKNDSPALSPKWFFQLVDASGLLLATGVTFFALPYWVPSVHPDYVSSQETSSAALLILTLPLWLLLLDWGGTYVDPVQITYVRAAFLIGRVTLIGLAFVSLIVFGIKEQGTSRLLVFSFGWLVFITLTGIRFLEKSYYGTREKAGYYARHLLVIGSSECIRMLVQLIQSSRSGSNYQVTPWPLSPRNSSPEDQTPATFTLELRRHLAKEPIDEIVLVSGSDTQLYIDPVLSASAEQGQPVRLVSESILRFWSAPSLSLKPYADLFLGFPSLSITRIERKPAYEFFKRLGDILVSAVLLILLSPVLAVIALAVKLSSPGPAFYRWCVLGQNNREFTGYKFRTMVPNADQLKVDLLKYNEMSGPAFKMKNDPRITPIGRFLRRYSLDELPQLYNVLKGDMSLVGPRPPLRNEFERFEFWQARKLNVKPGITCLWQIGGRNEIADFDQWVRMDLEYIDRRSIAFDLGILARTALSIIKGTGR